MSMELSPQQLETAKASLRLEFDLDLWTENGSQPVEPDAQRYGPEAAALLEQVGGDLLAALRMKS